MNDASGTLTDALLDPTLKNDPAGPRVTFYDDATGERVELFGPHPRQLGGRDRKTCWRDEFGVEPGARVAVLLPAPGRPPRSCSVHGGPAPRSSSKPTRTPRSHSSRPSTWATSRTYPRSRRCR